MAWKRFDAVIYKIAGILCALSTGIAVILMLAEVFTRFIMQVSVPWTGELVKAMYIYIVFFGLILVEREGSEIRTTLLIEKLPDVLHKLWETIVAVMSIAFNICLFIGCFEAIPSTITFLGSLPTVSEKIFYYPIIFAVPFVIIYQAYHIVMLYKSGKEEDK